MKITSDLERLRTWLVDGHDFRAGPPPANGRQAPEAPAVMIKPLKVRRVREPRDKASTWLKAAGISLAVLAAVAAAVSYWAQFTFIDHVKHQKIISYIQAGIPDAGALVFACLGIALALHGKRAIRPRFLNLGCVGLSIGMNALASAAGWKPTAVWVMAPAVYAVASDTLIGVLRAYAIARHKALNAALAADDSTPLQVVGAFLLWVLRLVMDPADTFKGFRAWVLSTPAAPRPRAVVTPAKVIAPKRPQPHKAISAGPREGTKTSRFLALAEERYGLLAGIPLDRVSPVCTELAPEVGLDTAAARAALRKAVLAAQNGSDH